MTKKKHPYTKIYVKDRLRPGRVTLVLVAILSLFCNPMKVISGPLDRGGTQWAPFIEWEISNSTYSGNPFDLVGSVTFTHAGSGEVHTTEMFYDEGNTWKFRFTGTRTGVWNFTSSSSDSDLNNLTGVVTVSSNSDPNVNGFVTKFGNKWGRTGTDEAFIPQFVMYKDPSAYYNKPSVIDADIQTFFNQHGFNGFHLYAIAAGWFDINESGGSYNSIDSNDPNPDPKTFEALELLISKTHTAGGVVHIWMWGDQSRKQTPKKWGANGNVDKRLQRYIAARLGPLPGWTMGYGFDLWEWASESQLQGWHNYMHAHMGWSHYLGARSEKNKLTQLYEGMDYSSYEQHRPDYNKYVETIEARPSKPSFSEDRFRVRDEGRDKDYNMEDTRRGLWDSAMAGGVANIWGHLLNSPSSGAPSGGEASGPYPKPEWIKTWAEFFDGRFLRDMIRANSITNGVCLKHPNNTQFVFYKESTSSIQMNLSTMSGAQRAVAVDAKLPYLEIDMGKLTASEHTWIAPYDSDWAIAVGEFRQNLNPPVAPTNLRLVQ